MDEQCPACKSKATLIAWRNVAIIYACYECDKTFEVALTSSNHHIIEPYTRRSGVTEKDMM